VTGGILVIGYGSTLRTDDGVGWHAARRLEADPRLAGTTVVACHQLTPEVALDLSRASFAVLIDASASRAPGTFAVDSLAAAPSGPSGSHHVAAAELVALAETLYGHAPEVVTVGVGPASLELGEGLSPAVEAILPAIVDAVAELVAARLASHEPATGTARGA
jgi:hydrogenase maturation protease